ncbi:MAG: 50S ribosomal protein L24e, partial [Halobacteriales archaeon]
MAQTRECDFCGETIAPGTGLMYVRTDGTTFHFCSSKCESNYDLGRDPEETRWTRTAREAKAEAAPPEPEAPGEIIEAEAAAAEVSEELAEAVGPDEEPSEAAEPAEEPTDEAEADESEDVEAPTDEAESEEPEDVEEPDEAVESE